MYTIEEAKKAITEYYENNEEDWNDTAEELDSYNGFLGDDRYYNMDEIDEIYNDYPASEVLARAFYGYDEETWHTNSYGEKEYGPFNPNRDYFRYNGYGNLVSTDHKDYTSNLDTWAIEQIIENADCIDLPDEVQEIINNIGEIEFVKEVTNK